MNIQSEMINLEDLVPQEHTHRKLKKLINFDKLVRSIGIKKHSLGADGYGTNRLVLCMILQFMENLSDREFERFMAENTVAKWFCDFNLSEKTPDYSTFCRFRNRLGEKEIEKLFNALRAQLKAKGYLTETFTFVDATALISKFSMWEERDEAIKDGYDKFNNQNIDKYAKDPDVRIGAKGKNKFWIGYKKHASVDMGSGMINKVKVTKANVTDAAGLEDVCPDTGAVAADKGYVGAVDTIEERGCHPMVILKNNMKEKNKEKDRFISGLRAPYEGTFSKQEKRVRYVGEKKNQAAEYLYAMAFNFRRMLSIDRQRCQVL